jgi:hypothetical protein
MSDVGRRLLRILSYSNQSKVLVVHYDAVFSTILGKHTDVNGFPTRSNTKDIYKALTAALCWLFHTGLTQWDHSDKRRVVSEHGESTVSSWQSGILGPGGRVKAARLYEMVQESRHW